MPTFTFGRNVVTPQTVEPTSVLFNLDHALWQPMGCVIDWSLVAAISGSDVTDPDNSIRKVGTKSLRYGQVICATTVGEVTTLTITGTGGTYTLTVNGQTTTALAFDANAAAITAALVALSTVGASGVVTTGTSILTFAQALGNRDVSVNPALLTGGSATVATTHQGDALTWGPYDFAATDGRQTPTKGRIAIVEKTVFETDQLGLVTQDNTIFGALIGGYFWKKRLIATTGTHSLANGPTFTELLAVLPELKYGGLGY